MNQQIKEFRYSRLARLWSNTVLREIAPLFSGDVINVSGWKDEDKEGGKYKDYFTSAASYFVSNHNSGRGIADNPATNFQIDLTDSSTLADFDKRFDVVFNHTTLEHIFEANLAFQNLCKLSKDIVIIVVPFAQRLHYEETYGDYWRFTPMSLRMMFQKNGFEVVYEAANFDSNAGIYLLSVGSCNPEKWQDRMQSFTPITKLGEWIGAVEIKESFGSKVLKRMKKYWGYFKKGIKKLTQQ